MAKENLIDRREFLLLAGVGIGGSLMACGRSADVASLAGSVQAPLAPDLMADRILVNGKILTVDANNSIAEAIAIKGDKILFTGDSASVLSAASPDAKVIDLNGRAVTPGFIDPHLHYRLQGLLNVYYIPFMPPDVRDIASLQLVLRDVLNGMPEGAWVMGYYLGLADKMIPTKEDLDLVAKNNPVFLMHIGGHWGTANTVAMQIAGITDNTPSPEGGIIEKVNGELTGVFYNHRAMDMLRKDAPPVSEDLIKRSIIDTQTAFASCGVTSFHDNNVRELDHLRLYQELSREGSLYLRNELYLTLEWPADMAKVDQMQPMDNEVTRFAGYKFLIDGQGPTAYCHEPHYGVEWRLPTWEEQNFKDVVKTLHDTGLQICVHCIGDAAADLTLDAYEAAMNANPRADPRHRIEHAIITTKQATQRMKDLGVVVSTQPAFIYVFGEGWKTLFTPAQMERILVTREWIDSGVHVAIGSDAPSTPLYFPQATLAGAMTRVTSKESQIGKEQVLDFTQALRAHTIEGAYSSHKEGVLGSLESGKYADLVIWPEDPSKLNMTELAQTTTVDMTMVGGEIVFERA